MQGMKPQKKRYFKQVNHKADRKIKYDTETANDKPHDQLTTKRYKPELLAPAGTKNAFFAALDAGADAIYVGYKNFNARALAKNFTFEELCEMQACCREKGKKLLIAMNSLLKEDEIGEAIEALSWFDAMKTDGLIIQDIGLWRIAKKYFPALRLHASTLMGFHNSYGVQQAARMGFSRVVLAREMTLQEIDAAVKADASMEIEVFVHGALCYTYSGLCLFSSFFGGKSSTRGRCVQPCRRRYITKNTPGRLFSMSDMCGIDVVQQLADIGVASLKIEGRLKPANYVSAVTKAYRLVLDSAKNDEKALEEAHLLLQNSMGRQYTKGFLGQFPPKDIIQPHLTANTGQFVGKAISIAPDVISMSAKITPAKGDRLRLVNKHTDEQFPFTCLDVEQSQKTDEKGNVICFIKHKDAGLLKAMHLKDLFIFRTDVSYQPEETNRRDRLILPKKELDNIRKNADIKKQQINKELQSELKTYSQANFSKTPELWIRLSNPVRFNLVKKLHPKRALFEITPDNIKLFDRKPPSWIGGMDVSFSLPPIIHEGALSFYKQSLMQLLRRGISAFQVANLSHLMLIRDVAREIKHVKGMRYELSGHYTLNLLNSQAIMAAKELGISQPQLSVESDRINLQNAIDHIADIPCSLTVFGFLPLFTARARHQSHSPETIIKSPQDEVFSWQPRGETAVVLHDKPYSILRHQGFLSRLHLSAVIIDLSSWPRYKRISRKVAEDIREFTRFFPGNDFNFTGKLD